MAALLRLAVLITASLTAGACGGGSSPTAPSPLATTIVATTTTTPAALPAVPAPTTLTGTWGDGFSTISLTQNGSSLTGAQAPYMLDVFGGMAIFSGSVAGSASGANVTMTLQISVTVRAFGDSLTCRGADSFAGQVSGNTMTGTYTPNSSPYVCEGGVPLSLPPLLSGTRVYTRQ